MKIPVEYVFPAISNCLAFVPLDHTLFREKMDSAHCYLGESQWTARLLKPAKFYSFVLSYPINSTTTASLHSLAENAFLRQIHPSNRLAPSLFRDISALRNIVTSVGA